MPASLSPQRSSRWRLRPGRRLETRGGPFASGQAADGADDADRRRAADGSDLCAARPGRRAGQEVAAACSRPVRPAAADGRRGARVSRRHRSAAVSNETGPVSRTMTNRVRKAVFPVAGLGTRLLPATKTIPKEMVTIVDRPLIQYAVDEAREAGIEQLVSSPAAGSHLWSIISTRRSSSRRRCANAARASTSSLHRMRNSARLRRCASNSRWASVMPCGARAT